jgi:hypothetical protein
MTSDMAHYWVEVCEQQSYGHDLLTDHSTEEIQEPIGKSGIKGATSKHVYLGPGDAKGDETILDILVKNDINVF